MAYDSIGANPMSTPNAPKFGYQANNFQTSPMAPGPNPGQGTNPMGLDRMQAPGQAQKPLIALSGGGKDCVGCFGINNGLVTQEQLEKLKSSRLAEIMSHEQAHASAAGGFGGAIHIEYDGNGIPVGGHVPITMPGLDRMNPEDSLRAFQTILNAALAPSDPSGQDMAVAASAQSRIGQAQLLINQKQQQGENPPGRQTPGSQQNPWQQAAALNPMGNATPPRMQPFSA